MATLVRSTLQDGVATLTLDRPQALNALSPGLMVELAAALQACIADRGTQAVVLTGAGRAFSAGGDIGWFGEVLAGGAQHARAEIGGYMEEVGNPLTRAIAECPLPVVAAVNGPCVGGAVGIALAADIVLAASSAYFLVPQLPQLGAVPDLGATWMLARLLGRSRALGIALTGERVGAAQAQQWGLIWRCCADDELQAQAFALARRLGGASPAALRDTRRLVDAATANTLERQLADECAAQREHVAGDFFNDACARFLARPASHD
ncbi:enoyl-CoA hydratase/isomerase family protein [Variovorax saccharolyticus]|uniref:enoyl-CoA hydratase/isomerase family protein n=1 Tax=Variovorax saccharolyticus TaxID=3053516 RepID=UPI002575B3A8|nr:MULTISPECIES: enoyl-CoA hydratase-related protein [unclassified Variovorax]MDM0016113.1 enoyl-CoA hydratase-related protein [Variovorax sp. J22R187]MDM0027038.1 enoyl-CoA hydratase-related protein [Variovorax sp. J31P216]